MWRRALFRIVQIQDQTAQNVQSYLVSTQFIVVFWLFYPPQPITRRQILDSSKLKEFADDNFKFYENGRKLSKQVENTVGKGEIARYEQFLLFPQCFHEACFPKASKGVIVWEWVKKNSIFGLLLLSGECPFHLS